MINIHSHNLSLNDNAIISGSPQMVADWCKLYPHGKFSAGIHPWDTAGLSAHQIEEQIQILLQTAQLPQVAMIGEAGLDRLRGADMQTQQHIFSKHIEISETSGKPLILHVVKCYDTIMHLRATMAGKLNQPWIFHGFRGKPQLASQLLASATDNSPVYISLGINHNSETARAIPLQYLLVETDDRDVDIKTVIESINNARHGLPQLGDIPDNLQIPFLFRKRNQENSL